MVLLIGVGNPLRGDDGAGPLLAQALAAELSALGVEVSLRLTQQLVPELAVEIAQAGLSAVVLCDARVGAGENENELDLLRLDDATGKTESEQNAFTHEIGPATLLAYARGLSDEARPQPPCWLVTAPARTFAFGEELSAETEKTLLGAPEVAARLVEQMAAATPASRE